MRSANLSVTGTRGRQDCHSPASLLASMVSRLPGVYGSSQSEGWGGSAAGTVVALVEPAGVEVRPVCIHCLPKLRGVMTMSVGLGRGLGGCLLLADGSTLRRSAEDNLDFTG